MLLGMIVLLLALLRHTRLGPFLHERIADRPRRRLFVASMSFFLTFAIVRGMVFCIRHQIPPFHYMIMGGRHVHHLVPGILILLAVGYGWLCEFGTGSDSSSILASIFMSILYGVGAALTLDEGRLLCARRPLQHRCRHPVRLTSRCRWMGRAAVLRSRKGHDEGKSLALS